MRENTLVQKLDHIIQDAKRIVERLDHIERLITRETTSDQVSKTGARTARNAAEDKPANHQTHPSSRKFRALRVSRRWLRRWLRRCASSIATLSVLAGLFSFFPHVTISDPVQIGTDELFAYKISILNGGILPIYRVRWALAPRSIKLSNTDPPHPVVHVLLPDHGEWIPTKELMALAQEPGPQRHGMIMMYPGSDAYAGEALTYRFHIHPPDNTLGHLSPGDEATFTTLGLISAPPNVSYDDADFAIAIEYTPLFPPVPMQTCFRFHIFTDRSRSQHWFRLPNTCDKFPFLHR